MTSKNNLLIIFYKNPLPGTVKTRLAKHIGEEYVLTVYQKLAEKTARITRDLPLDKIVFYSDFIETCDVWNDQLYLKAIQQGKHLGIRMKNAVEYGLNLGYKKICLIGTDIYNLNNRILLDAFHHLDHVEVVIGPAHDGGYYLIGMKRMMARLFYGKKWGTESVFETTTQQLGKYGTTFFVLPVLKDIDRPEDLEDTDLP